MLSLGCLQLQHIMHGMLRAGRKGAASRQCGHARVSVGLPVEFACGVARLAYTAGPPRAYYAVCMREWQLRAGQPAACSAQQWAAVVAEGANHAAHMPGVERRCELTFTARYLSSMVSAPASETSGHLGAVRIMRACRTSLPGSQPAACSSPNQAATYLALNDVPCSGHPAAAHSPSSCWATSCMCVR